MTFKINSILITLIFISLIITILIYPALPEKIPTHWNIKGEIDAYGNKNFIFLTALLPIIVYLLLIYIPEIDPRKNSYLKHQKTYTILINILIPFFILLQWISILSALGYELNISRIIPLAVGILLMVIGNYMGQIRPNYTFGIKLPWTLADETVWKKTHRVGGFVFILIGFIFILAGIINQTYSFILAIFCTFIALLYVGIYSYREYKKLH